MLNCKTSVSFLVILVLFSVGATFAQNTGVGPKLFSFSLKKGANTSAGVYKKDGTLVRTLWSGDKLDAGTYTRKWDGLDDDGEVVKSTDLNIKVLSGNVTYEWEGARIGNTSEALTGGTKHRMFEPIRGMTILENTAYVAGGYNEAWPAQYKFNVLDPQNKSWVGRLKKTDQASDFVATDGELVYWAGYDPRETKESFVFATRVSNNNLVSFGSVGVAAEMGWGGVYSAISYKNQSNAIISGMAVQKKGSYLFVSRLAQNELQVLNKSTGVLVQRLTIPGIAILKIDNEGFLWAGRQSKVEKFAINANGTISSTGVSITKISNPGGFDFSPDGTTIAICDVEDQNVKGFDIKTREHKWTLGETGGYLNDATVSDNKFYFRDVREEKLTYIAYLADGSMYVGDPGNCRVQHYSASRTFIDRIMYMPNTYKTSVDKNNPKKLYADFMEFEIDYTKPLGATNGSWKLKKNWGGNFSSKYNAFSKIFNPITFPNGRVYSIVQIDAVQYPVIELMEGGIIRYTGITLGQRAFLGTDGSMVQVIVGKTYKWNKSPLTGFDSKNNPIWSKDVEVLTDVKYEDTDPTPHNNMYEYPVTAGDKVLFFNSWRYDGGNGKDYHLGVVKRGGTEWLWKTAKGTPNNYIGPFPEDGFFDNGNGVEIGNRAGGAGLILGDNIFWGYHGEFWKQSQTNKWNHVDANTGLFVGQFGVLTTDFPGAEAFAGGSGNVMEGTVVEVNGNVYLYHNDEGVNNGVHRWKITGLKTIEIQNATILSSGNQDSDGIDLMVGLKNDGTQMVNGKHGWTRTPEVDITKDPHHNYWFVRTGLQSYNKFKPVDVQVLFRQETGNMSVVRTLENPNKVSQWKLSGRISFEGNEATQEHLKGGSFLEVLDKNDKVITRFYLRKDKFGGTNVVGNDKIIEHFDEGTQQIIDKKPFKLSIDVKDGLITFKYADFPVQTTRNTVDDDADWSRPTNMRMYFFSRPGDNYLRVMNIAEMKFSTDAVKEEVVAVAATPEPASCDNAGGITWDYWTGIAGTKVSAIPLNQNPSGSKKLTEFASPSYFSDNYGSRIRGYVCVPKTGAYTFFISTDDEGELWLSSSANPADKKMIASVSGWTDIANYTKYPSQKSAPIFLNQGERYYIEALQKEGGGGDNLSVAWRNVDGVFEAPIPGSRLIPFEETPLVLPATIQITSPVKDAVVAANNIKIETLVNDASSTISKVEFYNGNTRLGETTNKPYTFNWQKVANGKYTITAKAITGKGEIITSNQVTFTVNKVEETTCQATGNIVWEYWTDVAGLNIKHIPLLKKVSGTKQLTSFSTPAFFGDNYASRVRGYICVPKTGDYTFYIATDDDGELWLSSSDDEDDKQLIATVNGWTDQNDYYKYPSQKSRPISLIAGKKYYIEALQKEGYGGDNLSVAWKLPDGKMESPIPGSNLSPYVESEKTYKSRSEMKADVVSKVANPAHNNLSLELKTYPNPFVNTLNIECTIPANDRYTVQIYTVQGVLLKTIFSGTLSMGLSKFTFNGSNLPNGVYVCRLVSGKNIINKQISLVK